MNADAEGEAPAVNTWRRRLFRAVSVGVIVLLLLWCVGQIVRDRWWWSGLCFYVPSPLLFVALLTVSVGWWRLRCRRFGIAYAILALLPFIWVLRVENQWSRSTCAVSAQEPLRMMHWNVCRLVAGQSRVAATVSSVRPDFVVLSEYNPEDEHEPLSRALGPSFRFARFSNMLVAARGELLVGPCYELEQGRQDAAAFMVHWSIRGQSWTIMVADLPSRLEVARDPVLRWLMDLVKENKPDLIVGDLNAPRHSQRLANLPEGYAHAYDRAGSGWSYTWPMPVPMIAIDHCIVGVGVDPVLYRLKSSPWSDHRYQILDFTSCQHTGVTTP